MLIRLNPWKPYFVPSPELKPIRLASAPVDELDQLRPMTTRQAYRVGLMTGMHAGTFAAWRAGLPVDELQTPWTLRALQHVLFLRARVDAGTDGGPYDGIDRPSYLR